jgi:anti-anti-sigma factor
VGGEVDADTAEQCRRALLDAQTFTIRGGVTFMDSAGLNAPVRAYHRVPNGGQLRVVGLRPNARRAVEITGLTGLFQDDVPDAPTEA